MQIVVNVPEEYFPDWNSEEIAKQLKLSMAILMFRAGQFSAGAACDFAEIDRYAFWEACKCHHIPVIDYADDELEVEFQGLKRAYVKEQYNQELELLNRYADELNAEALDS